MTATRAAMRIGDAERDAAIELLNRHFADGRLTKLEHEERAAAALTARTQLELGALLADLPDLRQPRPSSRDGRAWPLSLRRSLPVPLPTALGLVRLALLMVLIVFVAAHVVPVFMVAAALFVVGRLAFGWHRPWGRAGRWGTHW